jgi:hypothetical protein
MRTRKVVIDGLLQHACIVYYTSQSTLLESYTALSRRTPVR